MSTAPQPAASASAGDREWRVVISSCDAYCDLWPVLFHFLFRFWPEVPQPVYLVANYHSFADPRVETICVGRDRHWSDNTSAALEKIPCPFLLYLQDDYLLNGPVQCDLLQQVIGQVQSHAGCFLSLLHQANQGRPVENAALRKMPRDHWRADLQAGFWRKETLANVLAPGHNPWQGERAIKDLKEQSPPGFFLLDEQVPRLLPYLEAVKGGFWKADALAYCREQGIEPNLGARPCPPPGDDLVSKAMRSLYKRKLRVAGSIDALLAVRRGGKQIWPLGKE